LGDDAKLSVFAVMCLNAEVFKDLCSLYPSTEEALKITGLKKRQLFIN